MMHFVITLFLGHIWDKNRQGRLSENRRTRLGESFTHRTIINGDALNLTCLCLAGLAGGKRCCDLTSSCCDPTATTANQPITVYFR